MCITVPQNKEADGFEPACDRLHIQGRDTIPVERHGFEPKTDVYVIIFNVWIDSLYFGAILDIPGCVDSRIKCLFGHHVDNFSLSTITHIHV
jgi:hypothetical protein